MVKRYPPTLTELKETRADTPESEISFYKITQALSNNWHVWHSVTWVSKTQKSRKGEADFVLFNKDHGLIVLEVKGGIISVEKGTFWGVNQATLKKKPRKDPFKQARKSLYNIMEIYEKIAKGQFNARELIKRNGDFPLPFNYAVFLPHTNFKEDYGHLEDIDLVFDKEDLKDQIEQMVEKKYSFTHLEQFLIDSLAPYKSYGVKAPGIGEYFPKFMGANIYHHLNLKQFLKVRERELKNVNQNQDFLLMVLSEKKRCLFKGSAGSGKTFIGMKRGILNYNKGQKTLFLCYNQELREAVRLHCSEDLNMQYQQLQPKLAVFSIIKFLKYLSKQHFFIEERNLLEECLEDTLNPSYDKLVEIIKDSHEKITNGFKYDAIIIDEAQDFDEKIWEIIPYLLKNKEDSLLYVFYDAEQDIFKHGFNPESLGFNEKSDIMNLKKNLRNSVEIATYIPTFTGLGDYEELSSINGFKITRRKFGDAPRAIYNTIKEIQNTYFKNAIKSKRIIVLSHKKLRNLGVKYTTNDLCDYLSLRNDDDSISFVLAEPKQLSDIEDIENSFETDQIAIFKTISSFKGLERDIIFLIHPKPADYEQKYPDYFEEYKKKLYVGASRAKFKLYLMEYNLY